MSVTGIIAEFNPLHKGHEFLIKEAKKYGTVVCVISGNFVQRGDVAIAEKRIRALSALKCGADLVIELPVLWSMSTAQNFALGGVSALKAAGCDKIIFGSESGDISPLQKAADIMCSPEFSENVASELKKGVTFAAARQTAAEKLGLDPGILSGANNNLGIEYIAAAKSLGYNPEFYTVKRLGAAHDSMEEAEFVSASLLREKLKEQDYDFCKKYMPESILPLYQSESIADIKLLERSILSVLRTKDIKDLKKLPDLSEGIENKLFSSIRLATSVEELYNTVKVKRYTLARIRRLVLSAFIGADSSFFMKPLPYIRVLGFNSNGEQLLRKQSFSVPIIVKVSDIENLSDEAKRVFQTEVMATDLFSLALNSPMPCGLEYTAKLIKTEC